MNCSEYYCNVNNYLVYNTSERKKEKFLERNNLSFNFFNNNSNNYEYRNSDLKELKQFNLESEKKWKRDRLEAEVKAEILRENEEKKFLINKREGIEKNREFFFEQSANKSIAAQTPNGFTVSNESTKTFRRFTDSDTIEEINIVARTYNRKPLIRYIPKELLRTYEIYYDSIDYEEIRIKNSKDIKSLEYELINLEKKLNNLSKSEIDSLSKNDDLYIERKNLFYEYNKLFEISNEIFSNFNERKYEITKSSITRCDPVFTSLGKRANNCGFYNWSFNNTKEDDLISYKNELINSENDKKMEIKRLENSLKKDREILERISEKNRIKESIRAKYK